MKLVHRAVRFALVAGLLLVASLKPSQAQIQVNLDARKDNTLYENAVEYVSHSMHLKQSGNL